MKNIESDSKSQNNIKSILKSKIKKLPIIGSLIKLYRLPNLVADLRSDINIKEEERLIKEQTFNAIITNLSEIITIIHNNTNTIISNTNSIISTTDFVKDNTNSIIGTTDFVKDNTNSIINNTNSIISTTDFVKDNTNSIIRNTNSIIGNTDFIKDNTNTLLSDTIMKGETNLLALGALLSKQQSLITQPYITNRNFNDYEFKVFSQFGDDGLIQYLIKNIKIENEIFIEFGVEDYSESNTRFLMMNNNWSGFVMDGSEENITRLRNRSWFWKYSLTTKAVFITKENINELLAKTEFKNIGLLHIDLDGNDAHILSVLDLSELNPAIIIMEYNAVFGKERAISVPYDSDFYRTEKHYSNLYFGASLAALTYIANNKGYKLIGCNLAGNNAYYVRSDLLNEKVKEVSVDEGYIISKFKESRNKDNSLSYLDKNERYEIIKGLDVINVITNEIEKL
jgi:hypothetical protein